MAIAVYNVSATTARVSWPPSAGCLDTFYSVMYSPNWNSLLMAFKRKSFMHEERIPVSQTAAHLANLLPQTTYLLCVTCQAANPVRDQCQVFGTLSDSGEGQDRGGWELATGAWLTCCLLLLVIAGVLLWGCMHGWTGRCHLSAGGSHGSSRHLDVESALGVLFPTEGRVIVRLTACLPVAHRLPDGLEDTKEEEEEE
uniref:Fibronectin type-III domain-containing protein n=1 Tax=Hippocampus comes TaxID=109280 RepID=A0A3Q2XWP3_HIPCM